MDIIRESGPGGARVVALGTFDGVHRAHQTLIREARSLSDGLGAKLRVCTFDRHPLEVLRPEAAPGRLQTEREQAEAVAALGADELRIIPFTRETAETEPEDFLRRLSAECGLRGVVVGWNYTFGRGGRGTPETLRKAGEEQGFQVRVIDPVRTESGEVISSSAVREKLRRGDAAGAAEMLGYPYTLSGTVVNGKHQGTRIGFPTANIETEEKKLLPAYGVYLCILSSGDQCWPGLVNIGLQPTLPSGRVTVEAHALAGSPELYGHQASVRLLRYLRAEKRFETADALSGQIRRDQETAREFFQKEFPAGGFLAEKSAGMPMNQGN